MKALRVHRHGSPAHLVMEEIAEPEIGPQDLLIETAAMAVNFPDIMVIEGTYQFLPPLPFTPGKDAAGTVKAKGAEVKGFNVGDRVLAQLEYGAFADLIAAPAAACVAVPDSVAFEDAAAVGLVGATAWLALVRRAVVQTGETVLITGAGGGLGAASIPIAKSLGAEVIASARSEEKRGFATSLGADMVVGGDPASLRDEVMEATQGRGADIVLENVGGATLKESMRATAWEGRVVTLGFASGTVPEVKAGYLLVKNISLLGLQSSDYRDRMPELAKEGLSHVLSLVEQGRMNGLRTTSYPLEQGAQALLDLAQGRVLGKAVLTGNRDE